MALCIGLTLTVLACNQPKKTSTVVTAKQRATSQKSFTPPAIPLSISTPEARADFLMLHYWDNYNFSDTTLLHKPEYSEQAFTDFVTLLNNVPVNVAKKGIEELMNRSNKVKPMYFYFAELAEKYLYDPNAPTRNETVFELFLTSRIENTQLDEVYKIRARNLKQLINKNQPGTTATNFSFTRKDGTSSSLKSIKANLLLVYFHNPDCHDCKVTREKMLASQLFQKLTKEGTLKVLALYPDEDLTAFKKYENEMPTEWIYAYDKGSIIKNNELYDLKAIPTLYLLDQNKTVLLKDVSFERLEAYFTTSS